MNRASLGIVSLVFACPVSADELTVSAQTTAQVEERCDAIVASIADFYSASFDKIAARKVPRESFSTVIESEMAQRFGESNIGEFGPVWQAHFSAVGDQLPPELIEGYIHYQCRTGTLSQPIGPASDAIDAACWNVAHDGKMEILDARMQQKDSTDLRRLSRAKILACITMSLNPPTAE